MHDVSPKIIAILRKYMRDCTTFAVASTTLSDLGIDQLDLPMICLDIEDAVGAQINFDEAMDGFATVGDLIVCVAARLQAKAAPSQRPLAPRAKRGWMSAAAPRQR